MRKLIALAIVSAWAAPGDSQAPAFRLELVRKLGQYPTAPTRAVGLAWDRSGVLWSYSLEDLKTHLPRLYRFALGAADPMEIRFDPTRLGISSGSQIVPNLFAGGEGDVFFPVVWRDADFRAAIVRVSSDGRASIFPLTPPVMARHLVVRGDGSFVVLGVDGGFFMGREAHCHLLHLYGADGGRLSSFSPCPDHGLAGSGATRRDGADYHLLKQDVDQGQLWLEGDTLFHLLPASREIRTFSSTHLALRAVRLPAPASDATGWVVRRLFPLRDAYLVFWMSRRSVSPGSEVGDVMAALHDREGGLRSRAVAARESGPLRPIAVTESGELICWEQDRATGKRSLAMARVALRP